MILSHSAPEKFSFGEVDEPIEEDQCNKLPPPPPPPRENILTGLLGVIGDFYRQVYL